MAKITSIIIFGLVLILGLVHATISAKMYTVGDSQGWSASTGLKSWVKGKEFFVGDSLLFESPSGFGVKEATEAQYKACDVGEQGFQGFGSTFDIIELESPGRKFFISTSKDVCERGLKLSIRAKEKFVAMSPKSSKGVAMSPGKM